MMPIELVPVRDNRQLALVVERCTFDLFEAHGLAAKRDLPRTLDFDDGSCGIVRLTGKRCELTMLLVCHRDLLRGKDPGRVLMRDWAGELANQLAGRIKHELWNCGAGVVSQTAPAVVDAKHICTEASGSSSMSPLRCTANQHSAVVLIDGFLDRELALEPADVEPYIAEGGILML